MKHLFRTAMRSQQKQTWRSPEEIVEIALQRSPVVMMNEAHDGMKRCVRTRRIGQRILPVAHRIGVRYLAMEALSPQSVASQFNMSRHAPDASTGGYLSQAEMQEFIQTALDLGWTLIPYEADDVSWSSTGKKFKLPKSTDSLEQLQPFFKEFTNWREEQQALNLIRALQSLPFNTPLLVWCGNSHHSKATAPDWIPMGYQFQKHSNIDPFVIDQIRTVNFDSGDNSIEAEIVAEFSDELLQFGGTAGFLLEEVPSTLKHYHDLGSNAFLFSTQNEME